VFVILVILTYFIGIELDLLCLMSVSSQIDSSSRKNEEIMRPHNKITVIKAKLRTTNSHTFSGRFYELPKTLQANVFGKDDQTLTLPAFSSFLMD
jgi:hypothetical protein